jgi:hypothetical protein
MAAYSSFWRNKWLTAEARTIEEMIAGLRGAADELQAMKEAGVTLLDNGTAADDYALLVTDDPAVAARFEFEEEEEDDDDEDEGGCPAVVARFEFVTEEEEEEDDDDDEG